MESRGESYFSQRNPFDDSTIASLSEAIESTIASISSETLITNLVDTVGNHAKDLILTSPRFPPELRHVKRTYILGVSGIGKSTLVSFLLGHEIVKNDDGKLEYKSPSFESHPIIGHNGSETIGCLSWASPKNDFLYFDCAGFEDGQGPAQDAANALCLSLTMEVHRPDCFLVMIKSNIFDKRGNEFLYLLASLSKCIHSHDHEHSWSGILFVVNDRNARKDLKTGIVLAVEERKRRTCANLSNLRSKELDDIDKIKKPYLRKGRNTEGVSNSANRFSQMVARENVQSSAEEAAAESTGIIFPADQQIKILEKELNIKYLSWLIDHLDHFYFMDWEDPQTATELNNKIRQCQLPQDSVLQPSRLYEKAIRQPVEKYVRFIESVAEHIESTVCRTVREEIKSIDSALVSIAAKTKSIDAKLKLVSALQCDDSSLYLTTLEPESDFEKQNRSFFSKQTAKTYKFSHKSAIPIYAAVEVKGSRDSSFLNIRLSEDEMTYSSTFLPAYHGQISNCQASVNLFVRKIDHPDTHKRIEDILGEINSIKQSITSDREKLRGLPNAEEEKKKEEEEEDEVTCTTAAVTRCRLACDISRHIVELAGYRHISRCALDTLRILRSHSGTTSPSLAALQECMETTNFPPTPPDLQCSRGHPMWALHSIADIAWTCSRCSCCPGGERLTGMRWVCLQCEESVCMLCQPPTAERVLLSSSEPRQHYEPVCTTTSETNVAQEESADCESSAPTGMRSMWFPAWQCGNCAGRNQYYESARCMAPRNDGIDGKRDPAASATVCMHCSHAKLISQSPLFNLHKHSRAWATALSLQEQLNQTRTEIDSIKWTCCQTLRRHPGCRRSHPGNYNGCSQGLRSLLGSPFQQQWSCCGKVEADSIGCMSEHTGPLPETFEHLKSMCVALEARLCREMHHTHPFDEVSRRWGCCGSENCSDFGCRVGKRCHHPGTYSTPPTIMKVLFAVLMIVGSFLGSAIALPITVPAGVIISLIKREPQWLLLTATILYSKAMEACLVYFTGYWRCCKQSHRLCAGCTLS